MITLQNKWTAQIQTVRIIVPSLGLKQSNTPIKNGSV